MKFFKNTNIWQKLIIALLVVICFQVMFVPTVEASGAAGILFEPINMFLLFLGDGVVSILHSSALEQKESTINISLEKSWLIEIIVLTLISIVLVVVFAPAAATFIAAHITTIAGGLLIGTVMIVAVDIGMNGVNFTGEAPTTIYNIENVPNDLVLPLYSISAEEIFKNQIGLFNVNFFDPEATGGSATHAWGIIPEGNYQSIENWILAKNIDISEYSYYYVNDFVNIKETDDFQERMENTYKLSYTLNKPTHIETITTEGNLYHDLASIDNLDFNSMTYTVDGTNYTIIQFCIENQHGEYLDANNIAIEAYKDHYVKKNGSGNYAAYPVDQIPNDVAVQYYFYVEDGGDANNPQEQIRTSKINIASELQPIISQWYVALRNLALILMLTILLYVGIRMMLTSVAAEKSKYKQMLNSWFIGMCLLVFIHYLMVFAVTIVEEFTELISKSVENTISETPHNIVIMDIDSNASKGEEIRRVLGEVGQLDNIQAVGTGEGENFVEGGELDDLVWTTNLMGEYRLKAQMSINSGTQIMYTIGFIVLVIYTCVFSYIYLKRVLYLAFLTIIAPLVAMTYPIDTIGDGQAQGFNKWLREYVFNLVMQPFHLLLYTILVSSAMQLSSTNMLYMLVALGFLIPAEKFLRSLFGFSKSETAGSFAGTATGAALMMGAVNKAIGMGKGGKGKSSSSGGSDSGGNDSGNIRYSDSDPLDDILGEGNSNINNSNVSDSDVRNQTIHQLDDNNNGYSDFDSGYDGTVLNEQNNVEDDFNQSLYDFNTNNDEIIDSNLNVQKPELDTTNSNRIRENNIIDNPRTPVNTNNSGENNIIDKPIPPTNPKGDKSNSDKYKEYMDGVKRRASGLIAFAGSGINSAKNSAKSVIKGAPKTIIKGAGGVIAGGVAGSLGLAAAISTGDPGNVLKYGGGAAIAGGAVGANLTGKALGQKNNQALQRAVEEYRRVAYTDEEYIAKKTEREYKNWRDNTEAMYKLENKFGRAKVEEMMEKGDLKTYHENGFTNAKDIDKLEKMKKAKIANDTKGAIAVHKLASTYGNVHQDQKKYDNALNKIREEYKEKGHTNSEKLAKKAVEKISTAYGEGLI